MRYLIIAALLIFSVTAISQKPGTVWPKGEEHKDYNVKDAKGKKQGLWVTPYGSNPEIIFSRGTFKDHKPVGTWEKYYAEDGALKSVQTFKTADSIETIQYHPDGKTVAEKGWYVKMNKEGNWKLYSEKGILLADEIFVDSLLDGNCKYYFLDGKLLKTEVFKKGMREGPFTEYYENGKKRAEGTYLRDEKEGDYKAWYENGVLESQGKFVKGQMDGQWTYFNKDGTPKVAIAYKLGKETARKYQNGTFKENYDSGIPRSEYTYEDAKMDGPFVEWYDKGEFAMEPVEEKEFNGYLRQVLKGTQEKRKGDYHEGKLQGEVIYYHEDGRIEKIETWEDGVLTGTRGPGQ